MWTDFQNSFTMILERGRISRGHVMCHGAIKFWGPASQNLGGGGSGEARLRTAPRYNFGDRV